MKIILAWAVGVLLSLIIFIAATGIHAAIEPMTAYAIGVIFPGIGFILGNIE